MTIPPSRVKWGLLISTALVVGLPFLPFSCSKVERDWVESLEEGLDQAARQGRLVLAEFRAEKCTWCDSLEQRILLSDEFSEGAMRLVLVRVSVESDTQAVKDYGVKVWPTFVLLTESGEEIDRLVGRRDLGELAGTVKKYLRGEGTLAMLLEQEAEASGDPVLEFLIAEKLWERGRFEEARRRYERVRRLDRKDLWGLRESASVRLIQIEAIDGRAAEEREEIGKFLKRYPTSKYRGIVSSFSRSGGSEGPNADGSTGEKDGIGR